MLDSNELLNTILQSLERQFPSVQALDRKQTTKAIGIGLSTLDLRIKDCRNLPRYIKIGDAKNSRTVFSLTFNSWVFNKSKAKGFMMKQNKRNRLTIRLDDNEFNQVNLNASISGLNKSSYIRCVLINAKPPIHKFDKAMIIQVARIGNNINQIAKHVNIDKVIDCVVLKQIIDVNKKLDDLMLQKQNPRS